ncbi:MAG: serine/threonine-protein kinase [Acidobacteriota bacterium]
MAATSDTLFAPGDVVEGRFRIERLLGSGGMGEVYLAQRLGGGGAVALKMLLPELLNNAKSLTRFEREVKSTQAIDHPNVMRIFEYLRLDPAGRRLKLPIPCLVMEYLEGESVADYLEREGPMEDGQAIAIVVQMSAALDAAHRAGIVHRDLKPDNVFLVPDPDGAEDRPWRVVLTDFGVARRRPQVGESEFSGDSLTASNVVIGTPEFMAPELLELEEALPASDFYALGLVSYQMTTGTLPFDDAQPLKALFMRVREPAPSPTLVRPDLDPRLAKVIEGCLERQPEDRFPDGAAMIEILGGVPAEPAGSLSGLHPQIPVMTRDHYVAITVAAVMALLVVLLVFFFADPGAV